MKVLSVALARAWWVFDTAELNPGGKDFFTHLFPAVIEDYKFRTYPQPGGDFSQGMQFKNGQFIKSDGTVLVVNVTIFSDGIAAEAFSSTADAEEFLESALSSFPDLGFAWEPAMVRRRMYVSQLNVKCQGNLNSLNPAVSQFADQLSTVTGDAKFSLAAIELWPDQTQTIRPVNFSFQRKTGEAPDSDRYWSQAALPTDKHIKLLEQLEALIS